MRETLEHSQQAQTRLSQTKAQLHQARQAGLKQERTVEELHSEQDQDVHADNPGDCNCHANPHPETVMPEAVLGQNCIHEGVARLARSGPLPTSCMAIMLSALCILMLRP